MIELSADGQIPSGDLALQAEARVRDSINRHFSQSTHPSDLEVVVIGNRYGEIIPLLTTSVSWTQWQANPQVSAWTRYYSASYALLQRHDDRLERTAVASNASRPVDMSSLTLVAQIDAAFDNGSLTGAAAQQYLSYLD